MTRMVVILRKEDINAATLNKIMEGTNVLLTQTSMILASSVRENSMGLFFTWEISSQLKHQRIIIEK